MVDHFKNELKTANAKSTEDNIKLNNLQRKLPKVRKLISDCLYSPITMSPMTFSDVYKYCEYNLAINIIIKPTKGSLHSNLPTNIRGANPGGMGVFIPKDFDPSPQ